MYEVKKTDHGFAMCCDGNLVKVYPTHALAWKAVDRLEGEPVNPQEKIAHWIEKKSLD